MLLYILISVVACLLIHTECADPVVKPTAATVPVENATGSGINSIQNIVKIIGETVKNVRKIVEERLAESKTPDSDKRAVKLNMAKQIVYSVLDNIEKSILQGTTTASTDTVKGSTPSSTDAVKGTTPSSTAKAKESTSAPGTTKKPT